MFYPKTVNMYTPNNTMHNACKLAYSLKARGRANDAIKNLLQQQGFTSKDADNIINKVNYTFATHQSAASRKNLISGLLLSLCGLAIIILVHYYNLHNSGYPYFLAVIALVLGLVRLADGWHQHKIISH